MSKSRQGDEPPDIPVFLILRELTGVDVPDVQVGERKRKISCPFHEDRTPSAEITNGLGFCCYGKCQRQGDAYKLLQTELGLTFSEALARAKEIAGVEGGGPRRKRRRSSELLGYSGNL